MSKWFVLLLVMFTVNAEEVNVNPIKGFVSEKVIVRSESGAFIKFMPVNELPVIEEIKLVANLLIIIPIITGRVTTKNIFKEMLIIETSFK